MFSVGYICDYPMVPRRGLLLFKDSSSQKRPYLMRTSIREGAEPCSALPGEEGCWRKLWLGTTEMQGEGVQAKPGQSGKAFYESGVTTLQARMLSQRGVPLSHLCFKSTHVGRHLGGSVAWVSNS